MESIVEPIAREGRHDAAAKLFRGLADPTRLALLQSLREGERRVVDLATLVGRAQPNVSSHLACLRDCGLIVARPAGRETYYALADERMEDVLLAVDGILDRVAGRVTSCPSYGACE